LLLLYSYVTFQYVKYLYAVPAMTKIITQMNCTRAHSVNYVINACVCVECKIQKARKLRLSSTTRHTISSND